MALDIVLHRSEKVSRVDGSFSEVHFIGVAAHAGQTRSLILRLKYGKQKSVARDLARLIVDALQQLSLVPCDCVVTWAPTSDERKKRRGFDQAELIARHVGVMLGVRTMRLLRRTTRQAQTGMPRAARLNRPSFIGRGYAQTPVVVVIDDVVTTGSTFEGAAHQLAKDGYSVIVCVAPSHKVINNGPSQLCG